MSSILSSSFLAAINIVIGSFGFLFLNFGCLSSRRLTETKATKNQGAKATNVMINNAGINPIISLKSYSHGRATIIENITQRDEIAMEIQNLAMTGV